MPTALEWAVPWAAERWGGARAEVGNIDLGVLAGEITIEDLVVGLPQAAESTETPPTDGIDPLTALLTMERIYLDFQWSELLSGRILLAALRLDAPTIRLTQRMDGSLELPVPPASDEEQEDATPETQNETPPSEPDAEPEEPAETEESETGQPPAEPDDGREYVLDRFELNRAVVSLHSEAMGREVLNFSSTRLGLDALSIGPEGIGLGDIDFEQPEVYVQRDWMMNLAGGETDAAEEHDDTDAQALAVNLANLNIERAAFTMNTGQGPLAVAIRLSVTDAGTAAGHTFPIEIGLEIGGGQATIAGQLGLNPISYEGLFGFEDLNVPPFLLVSYPELVDWLASGDFAGEAHISFDSGGQSGLVAHGSSTVTGLAFKQPETGELALEVGRLEVDFDATYPLFAPPGTATRLKVGTAKLIGPQFVYTNPPEALDRLLSILKGEPAEPSDTPTEDGVSPDESEPETVVTPDAAAEPEPDPGGATELSIEKVTISEGLLRYVDRRVSPTHETRVEDLRAQIDGVELSPATSAKRISVDGRIQETGTFSVRGSLSGDSGDLQLDLERLDLVSYDSLARDAGWRIETGTSSLSTKVKIAGARYDTQSEIVLHDLSVTPNDPGVFSASFGVSIELALALLRDVSGDITLSVPVEITEEGVGVGIGAVIGSALRSAIAGALLSPFKLVGALLPGGGEPPVFDAVGFEAGSGELSADASDQLKAVAGLLAERPSLSVALRGEWSDTDRPQLALAMLTEKSVSGGDFPEVEDGGFLARRRVAAALRARAAEERGPLEPEDEALLGRYVDAQTVPVEHFQALAAARRETSRAALVAFGAPDSALVSDADEAAEAPGVALSLELRAAAVDAVQSSP